MHGLRARLSLDLIEHDTDGESWDLSKPPKRQRALHKLNIEQPEMLTVSPICGLFHALQGINYSNMELEKVERVLGPRITTISSKRWHEDCWTYNGHVPRPLLGGEHC